MHAGTAEGSNLSTFVHTYTPCMQAGMYGWHQGQARLTAELLCLASPADHTCPHLCPMQACTDGTRVGPD